MIAQLDMRAVRASPGRAVSRLVGYSLFEGRPATTRGQWFNPVVVGNLRLGARLDTNRPVRSPVFIVGIGRSGTTLLGQLLALHPDVGYLNEPKALWHQIHPDDDIIGSYSARRGRLLLTDADVDDATRVRAHRMYSWYLLCSRSQRVVDKYPELAYRESFVRAIFPDARILAILRHPWDVVHSIATWNDDHADASSNWWGVNDLKWWTLWNEIVVDREENRWLTELIDPVTANDHVRGCVEWFLGTSMASVVDAHRLDYDDLLARPREVLRDVLAACSLSASERVLSFGDQFVRPDRDHRSPPAGIPTELVDRCDELYSRIRS